MCYGDIGHGTDGYYEEWARAQEQEAERQKQEQERDNEEQQQRYEDELNQV